jgi:molybdenum cofactor cytidylyltransferase
MRKFISGLVLGAGSSQRFGQPKQLLPFRGTTLLGWVVTQASRAHGLDELVVVVGGASEEIHQRVDFGSAKIAENPVYAEGCSSSYRAGIAAVNPKCEAIIIILGDQPAIRPEIIDHVASEWRRSEGGLAVSSYRGKLGHPMVFPSSMFDQLMSLHGDKAAWRLIDANKPSIQKITFDLAAPHDINTREDFERLEFANESPSSQ